PHATDAPLLLPSFPTRRSSDLGSRNLLGRLERPAAGEDGQPTEDPLLLRCEQVVAPADRRPQGPLPLRRIARAAGQQRKAPLDADRKSTRLNSSHVAISYAVFC